MSYGAAVMPLSEQLEMTVPKALQPWYANNLGTTGTAIANTRCLDFIQRRGPKYGYHPEPQKSVCVCKGEDETMACQAYKEYGLEVNYSRGARYLGGYIGGAEEKLA